MARKRQKPWIRAICTNCGYAYMRAQWRHHKNAVLTCGVRTCGGKLWITPNKETADAMKNLDRGMRAKYAKLLFIGDKI